MRLSNWKRAGLVLGIIPETDYEIKTLPFQHGDTLLLYTDGLIDAMNFNGKVWGRERLDRSCEKSPRLYGPVNWSIRFFAIAVGMSGWPIKRMTPVLLLSAGMIMPIHITKTVTA